MEKFNLMMRKEDLTVIIHISYKNAKHTDHGGGEVKRMYVSYITFIMSAYKAWKELILRKTKCYYSLM